MVSAELSLVTGAGGFVGSFVVEELLRHGDRVRAFVRQPEQARRLVERGAEVVLGDLRDGGDLERALRGVARVYHIAALFRQANQPERAYREVNVDAVRRLLDLAERAGVRRVVHCSTVGVLGDVREVPADEETPHNPGDIYQRTKLEGELLALERFRSGRMPGVVIRPAMIYGPGDTRNLKMFRMIAQRRFFYVGHGANLVHFVDVRDLARAFRLAMERTDRVGEVYIVPGRRYMPLREMAAMIAKRWKVPPPRLCLPVKPMQWAGSLCELVCRPLGIAPPLYRRRVDFFTKDRAFDGAKARAHLGYEPAQDTGGELDDIVADYRARGWA